MDSYVRICWRVVTYFETRIWFGDSELLLLFLEVLIVSARGYGTVIL